MTRKEHLIAEADDDIRLDRWFKRHFPQLAHSMLEKWLRKGDVRLDGKKAKAAERVRAGQVIEIRSQAADEEMQKQLAARPKARSLKPDDAKQIQDWVLYKDANLIIINKPFGLAVQGGTKITRSVDDMLDALAEGGERPKLVHRLDRDTSGVLVLARSAKAANALMNLFSSRKVEKYYLALVQGAPELHRGSINLPLRKKDNPRRESGKPPAEGKPREYEIVMVDEEAGQKAVSHYRVIDALARQFALVELMPETGRLHQLRVHMQAIGHSIVGDHKYGGETRIAAGLGVENKLHLHAWKIELPPILGGKPVKVKAPLPQHMKNSFKALGIDIPK